MTAYDDQVVARIDKAQADVADQLKRADEKAGKFLPLFGAFLAGAVALLTRTMPTAAVVILLFAAATMAISVLLLLRAVRPRINKNALYGFALFATYAERPSDLLEQFQNEPPAVALLENLVRASLIAKAKYADVSRAFDLLYVGLTLLGVAMTVTGVM